MSIVTPTELAARNRRRSKRVHHKTPVVVRFQDVHKNSVSENTHTMTVNDHGALILLAAEVKTQQIVRLENPSTGEELLGRVACLGPTLMGKTQVAVEFITPKPGFWNTAPSSKSSEPARSPKK